MRCIATNLKCSSGANISALMKIFKTVIFRRIGWRRIHANIFLRRKDLKKGDNSAMKALKRGQNDTS